MLQIGIRDQYRSPAGLGAGPFLFNALSGQIVSSWAAGFGKTQGTLPDPVFQPSDRSLPLRLCTSPSTPRTVQEMDDLTPELR